MVAALVLSGIATTAPSVSAAGDPTVPTGWRTFTDPIYHFTISHPSSWTLAPGYDGSHITLFHNETSTTFSPLVSLDTRAPATVIAQAMAAQGGQTHAVARMIDGWPVADLFTERGQKAPVFQAGDEWRPPLDRAISSQVYSA